MIELKESGIGLDDADTIMRLASARIGTLRALEALSHMGEERRIWVRGRGWRTFSVKD